MDSLSPSTRLDSPALRDREGRPAIVNVRSHRIIRIPLVIGLFWFFLLAKCVFSTWAVGYYSMPISSLYVWIPSLFAGVIAHVLWRQRRRWQASEAVPQDQKKLFSAFSGEY